jgi:hypothetical protein
MFTFTDADQLESKVAPVTKRHPAASAWVCVVFIVAFACEGEEQGKTHRPPVRDPRTHLRRVRAAAPNARRVRAGGGRVSPLGSCHENSQLELSWELTTREARKSPPRGSVRTVLKPPRDRRGTHLIGASADPPETGLYLRVYSSGGGTRTHNLRINSPPLCQLSYPGRSVGQHSSDPQTVEVG